jgi:hypothetical protein
MLRIAARNGAVGIGPIAMTLHESSGGGGERAGLEYRMLTHGGSERGRGNRRDMELTRRLSPEQWRKW